MNEPSATERDQHGAHCRDREDEFAARLAFLRRAQDAASADGGGGAYRALLAQVVEAVTLVHGQGYAVLHGLLDAQCVERLREGLAPLFAASAQQFERLPAGSARHAFHVHNALAKTRAADEIALHPMLRALMGGILGFDYLFHAGAIVTVHGPGCREQALHRDDASFYALPRPRMPLVMNAAIALDDFTRVNGGTRVVAGSCWWPRERRPTDEEALPIEMRAGSVLVYDGAIFHGAGANVTTEQLRRTLFLNYTRGWLRTQFNQFLSVPREVVLSLPAELQKDLGYQRSLRALGECDGLEAMPYLRAIQQRGDGAQPSLGPEAATSAPRDS